MTCEKTVMELIDRDRLVRLSPQSTVTQAAREMLRHHIGAVVVDDAERTVGIVTERDINFRVIAAGHDPATTPLSQIMTPSPTLMPPGTKVSDALRLVVHNRYRYALVGEDQRVIGIVMISRIFAEVTKQLGNSVEEIDQFIRGGFFSDHDAIN
jgi:CBS domain-containing protein